ncbi:uncharacterized protein LOC109605285 isoform X2 [Aethina tumida]|uniref:uncharacterized protein LOC109605285 isoform X2 n=1 Tax=Aethina tumida TaxID=116153 RepID=UPI0021490D09|nr:uncharacterized protein LOC109605285 isoform X2 [Aethina tumida]
MEVNAGVSFLIADIDERVRKLNETRLKLTSHHSEITLLQDKFSTTQQQLSDRKEFIQSRLEVVERTELIHNILNYRIYEKKYEYRKLSDDLHIQKQKFTFSCAKDIPEVEVAHTLAEIDKRLKKEHESMDVELQNLKQLKIEVQSHYEALIDTLDEDLEKMIILYNNLINIIEEEKKDASPADKDIIEINAYPFVDEFKSCISQFRKMKLNGWKATHYSEEKLAALIEKKGLRVTKEGLLITESGRLITYQEAKQQNLLEGVEIDPDRFPMFFEETRGGKTGSTTVSSRASSSDTEKIDSEDVAYLKENLGKPLTLALAEITAVQPRDPIHYLGHWLFKFRYNQTMTEINDMELEALTNERDRLAKERWKKFLEEEARAAVMDLIMRAEQHAMKREMERMEELAAKEEEEFEEERRDVLGEYKGPRSMPRINGQ